ncbi:Sugar kinase of the NBD/HSP70 family, may contain an N-terminal HTH domain [Actinacidiphila yanglinensis]|uniref:Sugar kinase of the NBD/HSP70 family, may contain an N-terminal HTH domain n=1 Tax=Actinacidiphila yanglinensis TaxID=310779 RepID=A0A1H5SSX3_9ACTN|nr:ROK family transcriptional regulator [Actinacidiphila yanglinensis]SEF53550.1 Sugar kinase of the NBD/HSP70 family, may contain an N-terminal HTH domain [Actinacidiphila yanglinensis]
MTTESARAGKPTIRRGTNMPRMGDFNESVLLDAIRRHSAGLSRVELAQATGLSGQTVSNITRRLLDQGVVRESGKQSTGNGKPRTLLEIVPSARYAVGVHLDPAVVTYVLVDLLGTVVAQHSERTPSGVGSDRIVADMAASVTALVAGSGAGTERVLGVGVAAPGPIDAAAGRVLAPPELPRWGSFPLRDRLSEATGYPVLLDKDVTAAVVAERWAGTATDSRNLLFFYLGTGSGMGLVVDDTVLRGVSGNAGEVGGLGAGCSIRTLVDEGIALGVLGAEFTIMDPADAPRGVERLAELAAAGEERAGDIISRLAVRIGRGVCAAATLLDVDTIVFGGPTWHIFADRMLPVIEPMVARSLFVKATHPTAVVSTTLGENVAAVGAASLVLDHALSARPTSLLLT